MKKKSKGFTLVELLVVVAILGVLAAVGIVSYSSYVEKAKQSATANLFSQVTKYIELELLKCSTGLELEAYEKFMSNRQKYSGLVLTSCETYFGDPYENNRQKFDAISGQIINYLTGYSGEEKGFNNPYGNDTRASGIKYSSYCQSNIDKGWIYCGKGHDFDTNIATIQCCTKINNTITQKYLFNDNVENFLN